MHLDFFYNEDKDIECLLKYGGGSSNSPTQKTEVYEELLKYTRELDNLEKVREFARTYIGENGIRPKDKVETYKKSWGNVEKVFGEKTEKIFGLKIEKEITAYLTITGRWPYSIKNNYFYVSAKKESVNLTIMHELWHFYTWAKFGGEVKMSGEDKYNDLKEALTEIINLEFPDILNGEVDSGYPQHQALRKVVSNVWLKTGDIEKVWQAGKDFLLK